MQDQVALIKQCAYLFILY